jgi:predicted MFS family arabinose efflux permease
MADVKVGFSSLVRDSNFVLMWVAMLVSTLGTFSLLVVLSTELYNQTQSALVSSSVFGAQWIVPIVFTFGISKILRKSGLFRTLGISEIVGAITSFAAALALINGSLPALLGALVVRGFVESITKSGRVVALKSFTSPDQLEIASSTFNSSYYLGIAAGTLLTPFLVECLSLLQIAVFDSITFAVSSAIYFLLYHKNSGQEKADIIVDQRSSTQIFKALLSKRPLVLASGLAVTNVGLFQGYHNVARTALPLGYFISGSMGVAMLQTVNILGIMAGLFFVSSYLVRRKKDLLNSELVWFSMAGVLMSLPLFTSDQTIGLVFYFCFAFCFEVAFVLLQNKIVLTASREELSILSLFNQSAMSGSMALCVLIVGRSVDRFGLLSATVSLSLVAISIAFCLVLKNLMARS